LDGLLSSCWLDQNNFALISDNPQQARESLAQSINASQEGIKILEKAIEEKRK